VAVRRIIITVCTAVIVPGILPLVVIVFSTTRHARIRVYDARRYGNTIGIKNTNQDLQ